MLLFFFLYEGECEKDVVSTCSVMREGLINRSGVGILFEAVAFLSGASWQGQKKKDLYLKREERRKARTLGALENKSRAVTE